MYNVNSKKELEHFMKYQEAVEKYNADIDKPAST